MKKLWMLIVIVALTSMKGTISFGSEYWDVLYKRNGADTATSIHQTSDGGYVVTGFSEPYFQGPDENFVLKLDCLGNVEWQKVYGSGNTYSSINSIQPTADGGYILACVLYDGLGNRYFAVFVLNAIGDIVWPLAYDLHNKVESPKALQKTADGGYILAGTALDGYTQYDDIWILKLDASGWIMWQKTFGGYYDDRASSIQQTIDGGYIVAGWTQSFGSVRDIWIVKLDTGGNITWQKTYENNFTWSGSSFIYQTTDGGYIVAAETSLFGAGDADFWILKLDANGDVVWQKTYGGANKHVPKSIQQTSDGNFIVVGYTASEYWILKLDGNGGIM